MAHTDSPKIREKRLLPDVAALREGLATGDLEQMRWKDGRAVVSDAFTKEGVSLRALLNLAMDNVFALNYFGDDARVPKNFRTNAHKREIKLGA